MLAQMMKAMHRHGCVDFTLTQQAEGLLRDDVLQEYSSAFTSDQKSQDCSNEVVSDFLSHTKNLTHDFGSKPSAMPNQNASVNQPVIPLEERGGIQATQPPVALRIEDLDTTEVSTTVMCLFKRVNVFNCKFWKVRRGNCTCVKVKPRELPVDIRHKDQNCSIYFNKSS